MVVVGAPRSDEGSAPANSTSYDASVVKSCQSQRRESNSVEVHNIGALMWSTDAAICTPLSNASGLSNARTLGARNAGASILCMMRTSLRRRCRDFCADEEEEGEGDGDGEAVGEGAGAGGSADKNCAIPSTLCGAPGK